MKTKTQFIIFSVCLLLAAIFFILKKSQLNNVSSIIPVSQNADQSKDNQLTSLAPEDVLYSIGKAHDLNFDEFKKSTENNQPLFFSIAPKVCIERNDNNECTKSITYKNQYSIALSGENAQSKIYAAIIEIAHLEYPRPHDYFEKDSFECELFVIHFENKNWVQDFYEQMIETNFSGGTRWAKSCAGFALSWDKKGRPIFTREVTDGPFIGGKFEKYIQIFLFENTKYVYKSEAQDDPDDTETDEPSAESNDN